ncbi:MAG: DUF4173 domain-containing protein [Herpetosiphonaceae bacterium]|nr:DUF4173 domain-containing protein [Herpetosiphonaceae bacterium]
MGLPLRFPRRLLLLALLLGLSADRLFVGRWLGLSAPLFVAADLLALAWLSRAEGRPPTRANLWLGGATLLFASFLAVRDAPVLVVLDSVAVVGLLLLLVGHYRGPGLFRIPLVQALATSLVASWTMGIAAPVPIQQSIRSLPVRRTHLVAVLPVARGFVLALPAVLVFGALLMAADSVFTSYVMQTLSFQVPFDPASAVYHMLVTLAVAWLCAGGLVVALRGQGQPDGAHGLPAQGETQRLYWPYLPRPILGWIEALTILSALDALFSIFMLVQGAYFFGGLDTLARTGMSYADYARHGFFELLTVACLALALLGVLAVTTRHHTRLHRSLFNTASGAMVVLVLGMLGSAFQRMWLYEEAYGFTRLRVYTHSFMLWLAIVLFLYLTALLRDRARIFVFGCMITALVYLAGLNVANPDALIVRANIARYMVSGKLDVNYLGTLSADATPNLVASLGKVDAGAQNIFLATLHQQQMVLANARTQQGWPAWNLARARALAAQDTMR